VFLSLENNNVYNIGRQSSTNISPSKGVGGGTSSRRTGDERQFSNKALDSCFLAPEILFKKYKKHTASLDVWGFGMILYCLLFGKKPKSFYGVYRDWYLKSHGHDIELGTLPFIPPSMNNFIYDPFSFDQAVDLDVYQDKDFTDVG
jgi:serine/threonine protein kinase